MKRQDLEKMKKRDLIRFLADEEGFSRYEEDPGMTLEKRVHDIEGVLAGMLELLATWTTT